MNGMPEDGGLYQPQDLPRLDPNDFFQLKPLSFPDLALQMARLLFGGDIPDEQLERICFDSFSFPLPMVPLGERSWVLELFRGPTWAFKDFGARFLARLMAWYQRGEDRVLNVLVATSGDTGGAVANGFFRLPGLRVIILYPKGRVSWVQERQISTLGENVLAFEVDGSFDDCQNLVKAALGDRRLRERQLLTTANSINVGRLLPQIFYYVHARLSLDKRDSPVAFIVPSGNFGNLTAAAMARRMGLPIDHLLAATTINDTVRRYLENGSWQPQPVRQTLATAMDIADPSNFQRLLDFHRGDYRTLAGEIDARVVKDDDIRATVRRCHARYGYILDPHSASGRYALEDFISHRDKSWQAISLATADPMKFPELIEELIGERLERDAERFGPLRADPVSKPLRVDLHQWKNLLWNLD